MFLDVKIIMKIPPKIILTFNEISTFLNIKNKRPLKLF